LKERPLSKDIQRWLLLMPSSRNKAVKPMFLDSVYSSPAISILDFFVVVNLISGFDPNLGRGSGGSGHSRPMHGF
jgi:hypothetical protein